MYADDVIAMRESVTELQSLLDVVNGYESLQDQDVAMRQAK